MLDLKPGSSRRDYVIDHLQKTRSYTLSLVDTFDPDDWFKTPREVATHLAWQVGHLAFAEYALGLRRLRGELPEDDRIMAASLRGAFGRGSTPSPNPADYPSPAEIREILDRVHQAALANVRGLSDAELDDRIEPHRLFSTKLGALWWCGQHEMLHAGQIGLLRRLLGKAPAW